MSQAITGSHRYWAWNIIFVTASDNATLAGSFQPTPPSLRFLTWRMLFGDITLSFNLQSYLDMIDLSPPSPPSKDIGLWVRSELGHVCLQDESSLLPCIYLNSQEQDLDQMIAFSRPATSPPTGGSSIGEYDQGDEEVKLYLTIVLHDHRICADAGNANICTHIRNGCLTEIKIARNPLFGFIPIPSSASQQSLTPRSSRTSNNAKDKWPHSTFASAASSPLSSQSASPTKRTQTPDLSRSIHSFYKGTCVITKLNTSWGPNVMSSGPGIEVAHIIPKSMYRFYPGAADEEQAWYSTNSLKN
ncbi:MAG: hypothetical protein M1840_005793 [Geoglossum simile]|nr:MAG: hypothetical protein M1840_005793 [Geoglossum simile]